jgi:hypothetical protein
MRKFSLTLSALAMAFVCQTLSSHATSPVVTTGTITTPASGGVTVMVTTSGYEFTPLIGMLISPGGGMIPIPPQGIKASVVLQNHTSGGIACALGVTGTPGERFAFTVYDSKGKVVWDSLPPVLPQLEELVTLGAGDAWKGSAFVPLFIKGRALPAGTYTLEASLFGSPEFSATTSFVVNNEIAVN